MTQAELLRALAALRKAVDRTIRENPVTVTIEREERVSDGAGGYRVVRRTLPPFQGRLMRPRRPPEDVQEPVAGRRVRWVLLAPHDADIRAGPDPTDRFEALGRRLVVRDVRPLAIMGYVYGHEAVCEEQA